MLNNYKIITITHRQTKLKDIGEFVLPEEGEALKQRLTNLKTAFQLDELMYLATCNRVMYVFNTTKKIDSYWCNHFFKTIKPELPTDLIKNNAIIYEGEEAMRHLYRVASSVDSLVVGEREILRQLRTAFEQCQTWKLTDYQLKLAFQSAIVAAKEVYDQTKIGEKPVSVVSLAIQKMQCFQFSKNAKILLIGAGQTNTLVAKFLKKYQYQNIDIFNRTFEKAEKLAKFVNGTAHRYEDLSNYNKGFDCLIVCTGATQAIIDSDLYRSLKQEDSDKKVVIDLSIPNNVDKDVTTNFNMNYIEIEDLRQLAKENLAFRVKEVSKAEQVLASHLRQFKITFQQRKITRAMRDVPREIKAIKAHAMNKVFKKDLEQLDEETIQLLEKMMSYMEKRCIGIPMKAAKEALVV